MGSRSDETAQFYGIVWGKNCGTRFDFCQELFFSSIPQILEDLGPIDVVDSDYLGQFGGGGSPPPMFSINVTGPRTTRAGSCTWWLTTDVPNANIEWSIFGQPIGTGQTLQYNVTEGVWLDAVTWNSDGDGATSSIWVDVSDSYERCYVE
jgi:hypothetical protein